MRLLAAGLPALLAFVARVLTGPHTIDDAYITFRYAVNLAEGSGFVYNPGEWVLGTTAPLWGLLLGGGYKLGLTDLPWLATVLSAACDAASAALLVAIGIRLGWRPVGAALLGVAWAMNPMSIAFATGGMETSLFVLLALGVLSLATLGHRLERAAALAGVATFVRPEGALLIVVVLAWTWLTERRQVTRAFVAAGAPLLTAGLTLWMVYGSPLPNSVAAKQVAYVRVAPLENVMALFVQAGLPGWSTYLLAVIPAAVGLLLAVFGVLALFELSRRGLAWLAKNEIRWQPFGAFAVLYLAFYVVAGLRGVRLFPWYLVPIEPFYLLGAAAGLSRLAGLWRAPWLAALLVIWQLPAIDWHAPLMPSGEGLAREQLYLQVGHRLADQLTPGAVIAAPEIGALGYASNLRVLDTVGLVSPVASGYYPLPAEQLVTDNAVPTRLILDQHPDAVVTLDVFAQKTLLSDETFQRDYRLMAEYPTSVWNSQRLLVFERVAKP